MNKYIKIKFLFFNLICLLVKIFVKFVKRYKYFEDRIYKLRLRLRVKG